MGIRRVTITFDARQKADARRIFDLLSQDDAICFDATLHDASGKTVIECIAVHKDVAPLLSFLSTTADVGTESGATVAISDMLATVPPIDERIARRSASRANDDETPIVSRSNSHKYISQALTAAEVRSRMSIDEIFLQIDSSSRLTFDYVAMLIAASALAAAGLVQDSSVTLVASMLVSPLMSPILAITFGLAVGNAALTRRGLRNELVGVLLCLLIGLTIGSVLAPILGPHAFNGELDGGVWAAYAGSNASWPYRLESTQIRSRGSAASLISGTVIALPSGFALVLAMTGGSQNALVGVAIAAALLPPIVNAGLCFALAFWWQVLDPQANWWRDVTELWHASDWYDALLGNAPPAVPDLSGVSAAASAALSAHAAALAGAAGATPTTTVSTTTVTTAEGSVAAPADHDDASPLVSSPSSNVTITTTTTTTTSIHAAALPAADGIAHAQATMGLAAPPSGRRHPYIVVAVHGFWSFVLFVLNLISIVLIGTATFRLKGVTSHAADAPLVMGANREQRRSLLRALWHDAFEQVLGDQARGVAAGKTARNHAEARTSRSTDISYHADQLRAGSAFPRHAAHGQRGAKEIV